MQRGVGRPSKRRRSDIADRINHLKKSSLGPETATDLGAWPRTHRDWALDILLQTERLGEQKFYRGANAAEAYESTAGRGGREICRRGGREVCRQVRP